MDREQLLNLIRKLSLMCFAEDYGGFNDLGMSVDCDEITEEEAELIQLLMRQK